MGESIHQISLFAAFTAGLLSFVSPCVLPLVPSYLSYITGLSVEQLADVTERTEAAPSPPEPPHVSGGERNGCKDPDQEKTAKAMRPSPTLNAIVDAIA